MTIESFAKYLNCKPFTKTGSIFIYF